MALGKYADTIDFNFEILHGCKWSCAGCEVNKTGQHGFVEGDIEKLTNLMDDFTNNSYTPSIAILGPTDIFTASNTKQVLLDPKFKTLSGYFTRFTLTTTFLEIDTEIIEILNTIYKNKEIEFRVIVDAAQFENDKYISKVRDNLLLTKQLINYSPIPIAPQLNLFDMCRNNLSNVIADYQKINDRSLEYFGEGIDFAFPFSRNDDIPDEQKLNMFRWLRSIINHYVNTDTCTTIHHHMGLSDSDYQVFSYRNGKCYLTPKVYDEYISFKEPLEIPLQQWTAKEFEDYEHKLIEQQFNNIDNKPCRECKYVANCTRKYVPFFMDYMNTQECLLPIIALDVVNYPRIGE